MFTQTLNPYKWRGLKNEELSKVTGIPGCVYVHDFGYIGGNRTYEGALAMARKALTCSPQSPIRTSN